MSHGKSYIDQAKELANTALATGQTYVAHAAEDERVKGIVNTAQSYASSAYEGAQHLTDKIPNEQAKHIAASTLTTGKSYLDSALHMLHPQAGAATTTTTTTPGTTAEAYEPKSDAIGGGLEDEVLSGARIEPMGSLQKPTDDSHGVMGTDATLAKAKIEPLNPVVE